MQRNDVAASSSSFVLVSLLLSGDVDVDVDGCKVQAQAQARMASCLVLSCPASTFYDGDGDGNGVWDRDGRRECCLHVGHGMAWRGVDLMGLDEWRSTYVCVWSKGKGVRV